MSVDTLISDTEKDVNTRLEKLRVDIKAIPPTPTPTPTPTPSGKKWMMLNGPDWNYSGGNMLATLQRDLISEYSVFVYVPKSDGSGWSNLGNETLKKQITDAFHASGKKVTMSIGGGGASFTPILQTVLGNATTRQNIANAVKATCASQGYDGVKIDYEWYGVTNPNGTSNESNMLDFVQKLRAALGTGKLITMDLIHRNDSVITSKTASALNQLVDYYAVMIYDGLGNPVPYSTVTSKMNAWAQVIPKSKLLAGMAIGQYSQSIFGQVCDFVKTDGYGGIMIWEAVALTGQWYDIIRSKFGAVA